MVELEVNDEFLEVMILYSATARKRAAPMSTGIILKSTDLIREP